MFTPSFINFNKYRASSSSLFQSLCRLDLISSLQGMAKKKESTKNHWREKKVAETEEN